MKLRGRVWKYGDDIDTDVIYPGKYLVSFDPEEAAAHAMEGVEKGFRGKIAKGDVLVVGKNFGCGSAREQAALALKYAGIGAVVAESFARTFYRNAINIGLPAVEAKGMGKEFREGDEVEIDLDGGLIRNLSAGNDFRLAPQDPFIMEILKAGGAIPFYRARIEAGGKR